jgi:hypothetical protein
MSGKRIDSDVEFLIHAGLNRFGLWFGLPEQSYLIAVGCQMALDAVKTGVEATTDKLRPDRWIACIQHGCQRSQVSRFVYLLKHTEKYVSLKRSYIPGSLALARPITLAEG